MGSGTVRVDLVDVPVHEIEEGTDRTTLLDENQMTREVWREGGHIAATKL